jgi:hypothetical protein
MLFNASGQQFHQYAILPILIVGGMRFESVRAFIDPTPHADTRLGGSLGADLLLRTDVEFDFAQRKVNFFSQDHCPGQVIYWKASAAAAVPMRIERFGYPILSVTLDGHAYNALLDTGSTDTFMNLRAAQSDFGVKLDAPDVSKVGELGSPYPEILYRRAFNSLDLNGIAIANIPILMKRDLAEETHRQQVSTGSRIAEPLSEPNGAAPLTLGMREMRRLHLYLAYKEQMLYVTPAEVAAAPAH